MTVRLTKAQKAAMLAAAAAAVPATAAASIPPTAPTAPTFDPVAQAVADGAKITAQGEQYSKSATEVVRASLILGLQSALPAERLRAYAPELDKSIKGVGFATKSQYIGRANRIFANADDKDIRAKMLELLTAGKSFQDVEEQSGAKSLKALGLAKSAGGRPRKEDAKVDAAPAGAGWKAVVAGFIGLTPADKVSAIVEIKGQLALVIKEPTMRLALESVVQAYVKDVMPAAK